MQSALRNSSKNATKYAEYNKPLAFVQQKLIADYSVLMAKRQRMIERGFGPGHPTWGPLMTQIFNFI